jgi:UDP-N-acetylglucosamine 1-carboxyvinyltransferase
MKKILINGGRPLYGNINVSGMKNAALPIVFASILTADRCVVENLPIVSDIELSLEILRRMGATVERINKSTVAIDTTNVEGSVSPYDLVSRLRGSTYLLGAELGRFGCAKVGFPGGCDFGVRPIDQHQKGFEALGAKVTIENGCNCITTGPAGLNGTSIYFDIASVGATINVMLAAVMAKGKTTIDNAAREPHIVDLANFLNMCGARISGAGTSVIKIQGVEKLHGCNYTIIPDMIEAGTYMVAAAAAGGRVCVRGVIPKHMETVTAKLVEMGADVEEFEDYIVVARAGRLNRTNVKTYFYPGFPTDMHPQISALLATAEGTSLVTESVWENRFRYVDELIKMNANITVDGRTATIVGVPKLTGAPVKAVDLRAGAAMIIAGLSAEGLTEISKVESIERGYDDIVGKLASLGADIKLVDVPDEESAQPKAN